MSLQTLLRLPKFRMFQQNLVAVVVRAARLRCARHICLGGSIPTDGRTSLK